MSVTEPKVVKRPPWMLLGAGALLFSLIFLRLGWEQTVYDKKGVSVQGVVTEKAHSTGSASANGPNASFGDYFVMYRFVTPDGRAHDGRDDVLPELWNKLHTGDPVDVEYLAASPDTSQIPKQRAEAGTYRVVALVCLLAGMLLVGRGLYVARRR